MRGFLSMSKNNIKKILIVGDWLVDEHWVTGIHRSPTSSRTGQAHHRVLQNTQSTIQALCGAGQTASILHQTKHGSDAFCKIIGLGVWHKDDTERLASMLDPKSVKGYTHHRITHSKDNTNNSAATLVNLGDLVEKPQPVNYGTTRIMRIYQHTGAKINLIQRIDWEIQIPNGKDKWVTKEDNLKISKLKDELQNAHVHDIDAIVIKDMCKGVVSSQLIEWLATYSPFKKVPWFILTKELFVSNNDWIPDWLKKLNRLLLEELYPEVTPKRQHTTIVALPKGSTILARFSEKENAKGLLQKESEPKQLAIELPMASVFFAALIANILDLDRNRSDKKEISEILTKSFCFTQDWMVSEAERVKAYDKWEPGKKTLDISKKFEPVGDWKDFPWESECHDWDSAFSKYGIIKNNDKKQLQLWRAMTDVNGYICCVNSKRDVVQKLAREVASFYTDGKRHHKSFMLVASPGSGKTFLVNRLAKSLGMRGLKFNITQMLSKSDILDCFDTIVTTQAQNRDEKIIVFFDEINAQLGGQYVYDTFLAPIEEGVYVRAGKTFPIDPCVWIFAGTEKPTDDPRRTKSTKASDFEARLTIKVQNLKINTNEDESARTEKVYLGASLLRVVFPDVSKISEKVLKVFHELDFLLEVREVEHFVKSFVNIQYGEVLWKNVPVEWLKNHLEKIGKDKYKDLENGEEGEMVEIIS